MLLILIVCASISNQNPVIRTAILEFNAVTSLAFQWLTGIQDTLLEHPPAVTLYNAGGFLEIWKADTASRFALYFSLTTYPYTEEVSRFDRTSNHELIPRLYDVAKRAESKPVQISQRPKLLPKSMSCGLSRFYLWGWVFKVSKGRFKSSSFINTKYNLKIKQLKVQIISKTWSHMISKSLD